MAIDEKLLSARPDEVTERFNEELLARISALPDPWRFTVATVRKARAEGRGAIPLDPANPDAITLSIDGPRGEIPIRVIVPRAPPVGAYLHIHGGGWVFGSPSFQDARLTRLADATGLVVAAVGYRLAPEYPFPAGADDCEAAARWLPDWAAGAHGVSWCAMGGESAGANLAVVALRRLAATGDRRYRAANLNAGCYDLGLTPSARSWGGTRLVLTTRDIEMYARHYLLHGHDVRDPDVSPLHADLAGLPPALFTVGTKDPLLDDSLFMAMRWLSAGNRAELDVYPGGCHVFQAFDLPIARASLSRMEAFLTGERTRDAA